jgi:hypothetical protein
MAHIELETLRAELDAISNAIAALERLQAIRARRPREQALLPTLPQRQRAEPPCAA